MQNLFSRVKRQTSSGLTGDLNQFRTTDRAYLGFIQNLISGLTESNEQYGNIKVTKRKDGITKVTIKDSATNAQVGFIYRNRDLYIVGWVVGTTFYIDKEVYDGLNKNIPTGWKTVINAASTVALSNPFSYNQILPSGESTVLQIGKLGDSLSQLTKIGDTSKRAQIMTQHLGPFVVAFSEAVRFPVVAREIQGAIRKSTGTVSLSKNLVQPLSLGHPSERTSNHVFTMYSLLLNWSKLSDRVPGFYGNNPPKHMPLVEGRYKVNLEKNQLNTLLGVANSYRFNKFTPVQPSRGKRDLTTLFDKSILHNAPLLEQQINYVDFDGNVQQAASPPPLSMASITHSPDVIGALHLLTVGMLYLYGKKMNVPLINTENYHDPKEAFVVAVDLTDRLGCFLKSAGFEAEIGFEEEMELKRQVAKALIRGDGVESVLTQFLEQHWSDVGANDESMKTLGKQLVQALAAESGLTQEDNFPGDVCFE